MEEVKFKYNGKPYSVCLEGGWVPVGDDDEVEAYGDWIQENFAKMIRNQEEGIKISRSSVEDQEEDDVEYDSDWYESLPTAEARSEYFLTAQDLAALPYKNDYNGFAKGRATKFYRPKDLEKVAVCKHGAVKLAQKRAIRSKREEKQQQKVLEAAKAEEEFRKAQNENAAENCAASPSGNPGVSDQTLESIRKQVRLAFQPCLTWQYLDSRLSQRGCDGVIQVPRVSPEEYAALIGRPHDPQLQTLVKTGAWYSASVSYLVFFDTSEPMFGTSGIVGLDPSYDLTVKLKPASSILSVRGFIRPMGAETSKRFRYI